MQWKEIERVMRENKRYLDMLEEYDRTGHLPTERIRRSFTLSREAFAVLKEKSRKRGKSMSAFLEEMIQKS